MTRQVRHHHLTRHVDESKLRAALHDAESGTTAKIHVTVADRFRGSTLDHAADVFRRMGLDEPTERNGVLFFVAPARREFAIIGDAGIHGRAGHAFWQRVAGAMSDRIRGTGLTDGLVLGIEEAGAELRRHFPSAR